MEIILFGTENSNILSFNVKIKILYVFALKRVVMIYGNQIFPIIVRDIKIKFIISLIVLSMETNLNTQVKMLYKP